MINNIKSNKVNVVIDNELTFDSRNSLGNSPVKDSLPIVTMSLIDGKIYL